MLALVTVSVMLTVACGLLLWHNRRLIGDLIYVEREIKALSEVVKEFDGHLEIIYGLETFYGDETLKNLLRHSKTVGRYIKEFEKTTSILFTDEEYNDEEYDEQGARDNEITSENDYSWKGEKHEFGLIK